MGEIKQKEGLYEPARPGSSWSKAPCPALAFTARSSLCSSSSSSSSSSNNNKNNNNNNNNGSMGMGEVVPL